ncbi:MAG: DUF177 domain-containing protein [Gemmataceae bacterium]|nr:DUF177 domain-containing protein [Gemmataceae bacterium]
MLFNVSQLLREPVGSTRRFSLEQDPPVHRGSALLTRTPGGVLVHVDAEVIIEDRCSRCLVPFGYPAHVRFDEIYVQQVDVLTGVRLQQPEDLDAFLIGLDHTIDITEAVRQYTEVAAAMQPLCRPDCPGICPECGQDLSLASCRCDRSPADSRWAALAALKRSTNG